MATDTRVPVVAAKGGSFLTESRTPEEVFTPEDFSDEQRMIADTASEFMEKEVLPRLSEILSLKYEATREMIRKAGELGLLGIEIPEEYGGLGLAQGWGWVSSQRLAGDGCFAGPLTPHNRVEHLPAVYFCRPAP